MRRGPGLALAAALLLTAVLTAGCAFTGNTLGGREKCWPEDAHRMPSLWRGILRIDATGGRLETPEGDVIPLLDGALTSVDAPEAGGMLLRGSDVVARDGDDVTLFGGAGSDGKLVVCGVEENRSS